MIYHRTGNSARLSLCAGATPVHSAIFIKVNMLANTDLPLVWTMEKKDYNLDG